MGFPKVLFDLPVSDKKCEPLLSETGPCPDMDSLVAGVHGGTCGEGSSAGHFTGHPVGPKIFSALGWPHVPQQPTGLWQ